MVNHLKLIPYPMYTFDTNSSLFQYLKIGMYSYFQLGCRGCPKPCYWPGSGTKKTFLNLFQFSSTPCRS